MIALSPCEVTLSLIQRFPNIGGVVLKKIIIVGAGGFARELQSWIFDSKEAYGDWDVCGFLDINENAPNINLPIVLPKNYEPKEGEFLVMGIAGPQLKKKVAEDLLGKGAKFLPFIHRNVIIGRNVLMGRGCVVCPGSILSCDIAIGDFVTFNCYSCVGHDASIGSFSTLSPHVDVTGFAKVGECVLLGSHASVLPSIQVEDDSIVGAGSIVVDKVKKGCTVLGNPAKLLFDQGGR